MKSKFTQLALKILIISAVLLFISDAYAQRISPNRWFIKADAGMSIFFGDVKRYDYMPDFQSPSEVQPAFSAGFGKELSNIFSIRTQFLFGKLSGHKKTAHIHFTSEVMGGSLLADVNLINLFTGSDVGDSPFSIGASMGVGYMKWNSKLYNIKSSTEDVLLVESSDGAISIPLSLNMEYALNNHWSLYIEGGLHIVFSDEVDAKAGGIAYDMINYDAIGVCYKFNSKKKSKKSRITYALDASIYEPLPRDKVVSEEKTEYLSESNDTGEVVENMTGEDTSDQADEVIAADEAEINHQLEKEAMEKEKWAAKEETPWEGVVFTVQVAASKTPLLIDDFKKKFNIKEDLIEKYDGDWYRYSSGSFTKIWKARELRNSFRSVNNIKDAFIVVYRDEEHITLVEAMDYATSVQKSKEPVDPDVDQAFEKVHEMVTLKNTIPQEGVVLGVQIISIKKDAYPLGIYKFEYGFVQEIIVDYDIPWYKIVLIGFDTYEEAVALQDKARKDGFIDAFIVGYKDGKRISIRQLKEELAK